MDLPFLVLPFAQGERPTTGSKSGNAQSMINKRRPKTSTWQIWEAASLLKAINLKETLDWEPQRSKEDLEEGTSDKKLRIEEEPHTRYVKKKIKIFRF